MARLHDFLTARQGRCWKLAAQSERVRLTVLYGIGHMMQHVAVPAIVDAVGRIGDRIRREDAVAAARA